MQLFGKQQAIVVFSIQVGIDDQHIGQLLVDGRLQGYAAGEVFGGIAEVAQGRLQAQAQLQVAFQNVDTPVQLIDQRLGQRWYVVVRVVAGGLRAVELAELLQCGGMGLQLCAAALLHKCHAGQLQGPGLFAELRVAEGAGGTGELVQFVTHLLQQGLGATRRSVADQFGGLLG